MTDTSHDHLYASMDKKETRELLEIWRVNDGAVWSKDEFAVIGEILQKRTGSVPQQVVHNKLSTRESVFANENLWQGLACLLGAVILVHFFNNNFLSAKETFQSVFLVILFGFLGLWKLLTWGDIVRKSKYHRADFRKKRKLPPKN